MIFNGPKGVYGIRPSDHQALVPMYIAKLTNLTDPDQKYYDLLADSPGDRDHPAGACCRKRWQIAPRWTPPSWTR